MIRSLALVLCLALLPCLAHAQDPPAAPPPAPGVVAEVGDLPSVPTVPAVPAVAPASPVAGVVAGPTLDLSEPSALRVVDVTPSPWSGLLPTVLAYLLPILAAFLSGLAGWVLLLLKRKTGIDIDTARDGAIRTAVRAAIHGAEEWAARQAKVGQTKPDGAAKLQWVLNAVRAQWPTAIPVDLARVVDEELGASPWGASGPPGISGKVMALPAPVVPAAVVKA